jgi:hypothetical protein
VQLALCWLKKVGFMRSALTALILVALAAPALAQERQWSIDNSDKQAFLVFGVPETADVGLSFWCDVGAKSMSMFVPVSGATAKPGQHPKVSAMVAGRTFSFKSEVEKDQASGLVNVEVQFDQNAAFYRAVMASDTIAVKVKSEKKSYPLGDADFAALNRACKGEEAN